MSLPELFKSNLMDLSPPEGQTLRTLASPKNVRELQGFAVEMQLHNMWCWAAAGLNIVKFYNPQTKWQTQCSIVNALLQRSDCCSAGIPPSCNQINYLHKVLLLTENLYAYRAALATFEDICAQIDADQPFACRIEWPGGDGHFVVVTGYDSEKRTLFVKDPSHGDSIVPVDVFTREYKGNGTWTHSCFTQPAPRKGKRRSVRS